MATNTYEYRGKNRDGVGKLGRFRGTDPGDLVEPAFQAGWRELTVVDPGGVEVGGIRVVDGRRVYWSGF